MAYDQQLADALKENERLRGALTWISHIELAMDKDHAIKNAAKLAKDTLDEGSLQSAQSPAEA